MLKKLELIVPFNLDTLTLQGMHNNVQRPTTIHYCTVIRAFTIIYAKLFCNISHNNIFYFYFLLVGFTEKLNTVSNFKRYLLRLIVFLIGNSLQTLMENVVLRECIITTIPKGYI